MADRPSLLDRLLRRKPAESGKPVSDSGRGHTSGFLDFDELNWELRGRQGLAVFDKMVRSDSDVKRNVLMVTTPPITATWSVDPHGGDEATEEDQQIADDLAWALGIGDDWSDTPLATPLTAHLAEALPALVKSGFVPFEITWRRATRTVTKPKPQEDAAQGGSTDAAGKTPGGAKGASPGSASATKALAEPGATPPAKPAPAPGDAQPAGADAQAAPAPVQPEMVTETRELLTFAKFGLRLPRSIYRWLLDDDGELLELEQFRPSKGDYVRLPRQDLLYYRIGAEGDNYEGVSMLRAAYKSWFIKDKVERLDAMGQEREAIGLPVVFPPAGVNSDDARLTDLEEKLAAIRAGELAYLIMPGPEATTGPGDQSGWTFRIEGLAGGGSGGSRDAQSTLNYHRDGISAAMVTEFMRLGQGSTSTGAKATGDVQQDPFMSAVQALADVPRLELNKIAIRRWVNLNYGEDKPCPTLNVGFADGDLEALRDYVANLVSAGVLHPDDELEDHLRQRGKLPPADPAQREARKQQEEQSRQAELEAAKNPNPADLPGAKGSDKSTTKQRLPAGGERVTERIRHLDDAPAGRAADGLPVVTPVLGAHKCACGRKDCPCDGGDGCTYDEKKHLADGELRDWEKLMPLDDLAHALDRARDRIVTAAGPYIADVAALAAHGSQQVPDPSPAFAADLTLVLEQLHQLGSSSVRAELDAQRTSKPATLDAGDTRALADGDHEKLAKIGWLAAKAIVTSVWGTVQRRLLNGAPESTALSAGEEAGKSAARSQATQAGPGALSAGREATADDLGHLIRGARYTSILDANRCEQCALADDGVLRKLDDPVRIKRKPPNPDCYGWDKCRCIEFYELDDEAPAYLDYVDHLAAGGTSFTLFDQAQPRDPKGRWTDIPHPDKLSYKKDLGGSTGARLYEHPGNGAKYVTKIGGNGNIGHLLEEDAADRAYRAMGVAVPSSQIHKTHQGPVKVSGFLEGAKPLGHLKGLERHNANRKLSQDFALDAVLSNWDVIGMDADNVLVRNGVPYRVDNGGALRYRAMGKPKHQLSDQPVELWTLRESPQGAPVFGKLTWPQIVSQAKQVLSKRDTLLQALPGEGQRAAVAKRLDNLQQVVDWSDDGIPEDLIRDVVAAKAKQPWTLDDGQAVDVVQLEEELDTFTLAQEWTPALHPRDDNGRFKVKVGGHALEVLQKLAPTVSGQSERIAAILGHKQTSTHTSSKGGGTTVTKHELGVSHKGAIELGNVVHDILATGGHKQHANSSSAKQSLVRLQKQLQQAEQAAEHHKAQGTYKIKRGPSDAPAFDAHGVQTVKPTPGHAHGLQVGDTFHQPTGTGTSTVKQVHAGGISASHQNPGEPEKLLPITHQTLATGLGNGFFAKGPHPADTPETVTITKAPKGTKAAEQVPPGVKVNELDLQVGDVVQLAKGGNKITLTAQAPGNGGGWVGVKSNGKTKSVYGAYHLHQVTKADGSALKTKTPDQVTTDAGGTGAIVKSSLKPGDGTAFGSLPGGTVFETLQGKVAVLDHATPAYTGYITAWDVDTGAKYEVPQAAAPTKTTFPANGAAAIAAAKAKAPAPAAAASSSSPAKPKPNKHISIAESWAGLPNGATSKSKIAGWQQGTSAKLDGEQKDALKGYTDGSYSAINGALREDNVDVYKLKQIQALDSVFDVIDGIPEDIVTHRGTHEGALTGDVQPGKVIFDKGFMSTSPTKPWQKPVILHIRLKKGSKALWGPTSGGDVTAGEDEIILRRSTMMQVLDVEEQGGVKHIYVEAYA